MHIGFFDSGLGGKLVADYFSAQFPEYSVVFQNDVQNIPYGNKSEDVLRILLEKNIQDLFDKGCVLVVVACNTLSVRLVRVIQDELVLKKYPNCKVLGVVIPTIEVMISLQKTNFLLLATVGTVASQRYEDEFKIRDSHKYVVSIAIPELAQLIEEEKIMRAEDVVSVVVDRQRDYEVIVLACTHYAALKGFLRDRYPDKIILSQDEIVTEKLGHYLTRHPEMRKQVSCAITSL